MIDFQSFAAGDKDDHESTRVLLERIEMQPGAVYPSQTLNEELIVIGREGSAAIAFDGKTAELTKDQALYLPPGSVRSLKAGAAGWKAFEVYSPVRMDHLRLAGQNTSAANAAFADQAYGFVALV